MDKMNGKIIYNLIIVDLKRVQIYFEWHEGIGRV